VKDGKGIHPTQEGKEEERVLGVGPSRKAEEKGSRQGKSVGRKGVNHLKGYTSRSKNQNLKRGSRKTSFARQNELGNNSSSTHPPAAPPKK